MTNVKYPRFLYRQHFHASWNNWGMCGIPIKEDPRSGEYVTKQKFQDLVAREGEEMERAR